MKIGPRIRNYAKRRFFFVKEIFKKWQEDNCFRLSAALSYYTIFSVGPMAIIIIYTIGLVFGQDAIEGEIFETVAQATGPEAAEGLQRIVSNIYLEDAGLIPTVVGFGTLVFSATLIFSILQDALNDIWHVKPKPQRGWLYFLISRLVSFTVVLGIGLLLATIIILNTIIAALDKFIRQILSELEIPISTIQLVNASQWVISFALLTFLFAALYKYLPDVRIRWRHVWRGALLTSVLFTVGRLVISFYLSTSNLTSAYGAAASLVVLVIWVNYSSWIFFFGAEYIFIHLRQKGEFIRPNRNAVVVSRREIEDAESYYEELNEQRREADRLASMEMEEENGEEEAVTEDSADPDTPDQQKSGK